MRAAFEMIPRPVETNAALFVDQPGRGVGKAALGIAQSGRALGLKEKRPARTEPFEHIVDPGGDRDELGFRRALEIRATETQSALEAAVLVEDDSGRDQSRPGQMIGEPVRT